MIHTGRVDAVRQVLAGDIFTWLNQTLSSIAGVAKAGPTDRSHRSSVATRNSSC